MPRFNESKYKPGNDSSEGLVTEANQQGTVLLRRHSPEEGCPCGCGQLPEGGKSTFKMGHDQRLKGKLIRAHLTDTEVRFIHPNETRPEKPLPAMSVARIYGMESYLEEAVLRREAKNRELLQKAMGSQRLIQVGRWKYTGQVVAVFGQDGDTEFEVEYVTKQGETKKRKVKAADTEAVSASA